MRHLSVDVATFMNMQSFFNPLLMSLTQESNGHLSESDSLTSQPQGPLHAHTINTVLKSFQAIYIYIYYFHHLFIIVLAELML